MNRECDYASQAFNSLSRDHSLVLKRAENEPVTLLSTPSLGITASMLLITWASRRCRTTFQLPLSGSLTMGNRPHVLSCVELAFQLPLSGSREQREEIGFDLDTAPFNSLSRDHGKAL